MSWWPLIRILPKKTNFTYVKFAGFAAFLSIAAVTGSLVSMFTGGFRENPVAIYQAAEGSPVARLGAFQEFPVLWLFELLHFLCADQCADRFDVLGDNDPLMTINDPIEQIRKLVFGFRHANRLGHD